MKKNKILDKNLLLLPHLILHKIGRFILHPSFYAGSRMEEVPDPCCVRNLVRGREKYNSNLFDSLFACVFWPCTGIFLLIRKGLGHQTKF
jgi:hypothetical protein